MRKGGEGEGGVERGQGRVKEEGVRRVGGLEDGVGGKGGKWWG